MEKKHYFEDLLKKGLIKETRPGYFMLTEQGIEFGQTFFEQDPSRIEIIYGKIGDTDMRCSYCEKGFKEGDKACKFKTYYPGTGNIIESPTTCLYCMAEIVALKRHPSGLNNRRI